MCAPVYASMHYDAYANGRSDTHIHAHIDADIYKKNRIEKSREAVVKYIEIYDLFIAEISRINETSAWILGEASHILETSS